MAYSAKIILDSIGPNGARLTTFELSYPRFVHAELMTHRAFSRNAASSRAIPSEKLLARVEEDPAMPVFWGANQAGMQARGELSGGALISARLTWRAAIQAAVERARALANTGLHKQLANRHAEIGMFITTLVTATEWSNFFALRDHADAQPELAHVAAKAHALYRKNTPIPLQAGEWHLPYVVGFDYDTIRCPFEAATPKEIVRDVCLVSVGRCAAVSYLNQDKRDPVADLVRADKLKAAGHMSPFEHVAQAMEWAEWQAYSHEAALQWINNRIPPGNLWGWRQLRKTLENEHDFSLMGGGGRRDERQVM